MVDFNNFFFLILVRMSCWEKNEKKMIEKERMKEKEKRGGVKVKKQRWRKDKTLVRDEVKR